MKMRALIAVLLLLNAAVLAWQFDAFARWGFGPNAGREPERLQQQVRPEAIQFSLSSASESASAEAAVNAASVPTHTATEAAAAEEAASAAARAARKRARAAAAAAAAESQ